MADLTGKNISDTYTRLVQVSESQLYDGAGTSLPINFDGDNVEIAGTLTAQTYVVSESITNVSSGSTIFGNEQTDVHQFTGSISTTNNLVIPVSARLFIDGGNDTFIIQENNNHIEFFTGDTRRVFINDSGLFSSNITASGNISCSGELFFDVINGGTF